MTPYPNGMPSWEDGTRRQSQAPSACSNAPPSGASPPRTELQRSVGRPCEVLRSDERALALANNPADQLWRKRLDLAQPEEVREYAIGP